MAWDWGDGETCLSPGKPTTASQGIERTQQSCSATHVPNPAEPPAYMGSTTTEAGQAAQICELDGRASGSNPGSSALPRGMRGVLRLNFPGTPVERSHAELGHSMTGGLGLTVGTGKVAGHEGPWSLPRMPSTCLVTQCWPVFAD